MRPGNEKLSAVLMIFSFAMLILLLMIFVAPQVKHTQGDATAVVAFAGSGAGALLCLYWSIVRMAPRNPLPTPQQFITHMITAMAGAEFIALLGIFIGAPSIGPWPFAIASWALILGVVLPRTLQYFRFYGSGGAGGSSSSW